MGATMSAGPIKLGSSYAWYVAVLLSIAHLVSFIDRFLVSLVMQPLKADLQISDTQLGLIQGTGFVILYVVAAIPLGRLADHVNRRNLIIVGIVFWSIATALCGMARSFESLFLARIGVGFGEAALVPAAMSLMASYFRRDQLGRAVSLFTTGASLGKSAALIGGGAVLAVLIAGGGLSVPGLGQFAPWQGVFILAAIPGFILAALFLTVAEPPRPAKSLLSPGFGPALRHIRTHALAYALHTAAAASTVLLIQSIAAWSPTFYVRFFAMPVPEAGIAVGTAVLIAGPLGHLSGGYLTDRFQRARVEGAAGMVMLIGLVTAIPFGLGFTLVTDFWWSILAFGGLTYFLTMAAPASLAGLQMLTPDRLRGLVTSIFLCVVTLIGVGLGPPLIGFITDHFFEHERFLGHSLALVMLFFATAGAIAAWASRRPVARTVAIVSADY